VSISTLSAAITVEVVDRAQQRIQSSPRPGTQPQLGQKAPAAGAEQVGVLTLDAVPSQQRVDAVLQRGAHMGQHDALAQQVAQIPELARGDIRLRQQVGAQQVRQRPRVDRVGLHARRCDRLGAQRMRQMQLAAAILQQLRQPLPTVGGLQREGRLVPELGDHLLEDIGVIDDPTRQHLHATLVDGRDMRALAMQVDTDVNHCGPPSGREQTERPRA
jgi:hypothetical protein